MTRIARLRVALALSLAALALAVPSASAHPLGNFTINHYSGLRVSVSAVTIDHVTDFAEIPTFAEQRAIDTDGNGDVSAAEGAAYHRDRCAQLADSLSLIADGRPLALVPTHTGLTFAMGQGSQTMRLVCVYRAAIELASDGAVFTFVDASYAERRGWREIVVEGDATLIADSDTPSHSSCWRGRKKPITAMCSVY